MKKLCTDKLMKILITVFRWKCARLVCLTFGLVLIALGLVLTNWTSNGYSFVRKIEAHHLDILIRTKVSHYKEFEIHELEEHRKSLQQFNEEDRLHKELIKNGGEEAYTRKTSLPEDKVNSLEVNTLPEDKVNSLEVNTLPDDVEDTQNTVTNKTEETPSSSSDTQEEDKNEWTDTVNRDNGTDFKSERNETIDDFITYSPYPNVKEKTELVRVRPVASQQNSKSKLVSTTQLDERASTTIGNTVKLPSTTTERMRESPATSNTQPTSASIYEEIDRLLNRKESETKKCNPIRNVIFLKTHKTGSSTIINIMQRMSHRKGLSIALPGVNHFLGWPRPFLDSYIFEHEDNKKYNIICNHARFNKERMLKVMSSNNTKIVTIIRDPLYQFESSAVYLNFNSLLRLNRSKNVLDAFFEKTEESIFNRTQHRNTHNVYLLKNPIAFDMGFRTWHESAEDIRDVLYSVKRDFNFVMISDYMAESLVLLKNELCWDMKDILYFTMNKRPNSRRQKIQNVTVNRQRIKNYNRLDYAIFEDYNKTFWEKVSAGGEEFQNDVKTLKELNKKLGELCLRSGRHYDKSQWWFPILGYKLKEEAKQTPYYQLCKDMTRSEIDYTNLLKLKVTTHNWTIPTKPPKRRGARVTRKITI